MATKLFEQLVRFEGFCCPFGYLHAHRLWNTARLARHLGISERGVRYWKNKKRTGRCTCRNKGQCCAKLHPPVPK